MKTIGILGGLGPKTTSNLYLEIVNSDEFKEYPNILISNVCFSKKLDEQIIKNQQNANLMLSPIIQSINQLIKLGIKDIILPCNTLEDLVPKIKKKIKVNLVTPVEETVKELFKLKIKKIGLLATSKTQELKIYEKKLKNLKIIYPSKKDQKKVSKIIYKIISNTAEKRDKKFLEKIIQDFKKIGCEKVVLGCTDISDLIQKNSFIIDSFSLLAKKAKSILKES